MLGNTLVGRYQIISNLGGGGFGETFVACDTQLPGSPLCVVKKLKPQASDPVTLETARRLFDTEAQVLYKLGTHDRIPQLLAYFEENAEFYLVQELIEGHDLSKELTSDKILSQEEVISLLQELLTILEFVHQQNVIHRDVNPHNILRRQPDGKLILIDFGAVKQIATQVITPQGQTLATVAIGTPGYIPSEQAHGTPKLSSDIYAAGIIAIQALTGLSPEEIVKDAETNEIIWHDKATVTPEFAQFLDRMVCYDFRQRYPSATVALQALKEVTRPSVQTIALTPSPPKNINKPEPKKGILGKILLTIFFFAVGVIASIFIWHYINSNNAIELSKQGNTFFDLQRYQDALEVYEKAVNLRPDYAQAWNGQGKTLNKLRKYKDALVAYDKAIQIQPDYLDAWIGRGTVLGNLQRYQEAIASFDKALELKNDNSEVWNARGEAFSNLNQYDQAIKSYEKAIELKPDNYEAWYKKGLALQNSRQYEEAIAAYQKVVDLKPDYEQAWYNLGNALVNLKRYQDAFTAYDKSVQYQPDYYQAWLSRGNILLNLRRYPDAIESFNQVIKYSPKNYQAWYNLGWSLHQNQRYEEAIKAYNKAATIKQNDYQLWYNLGNSQYILQKYEDAIASYNKAVRYKPDHSESWYSRGNALLNLKRFQDAIASYDRAIKYNPNYQQAIEGRNQAQIQLQGEKTKPVPVIVPTLPFPNSPNPPQTTP
ncbi:tetratricopeptide repeat protein [Nostoc sp. ChiSLP03a]|uniref:tetratricopeptide repeat protein n=1 Tax=Nostoc sp. ChiSLP03a TaxID=3075380 RepID=UPI002AD25018|nr:tetratricopeptide repeat protein [Nostoc sp. ChiSLP03a]MDZ8211906.1 tetratricopeptide repeat protein [Nostoc sp. ChiSLP03a]